MAHALRALGVLQSSRLKAVLLREENEDTDDEDDEDDDEGEDPEDEETSDGYSE